MRPVVESLEESRIRDFYKPGDDRITYVKRFST